MQNATNALSGHVFIYKSPFPEIRNESENEERTVDRFQRERERER